MAYFKAVTMGSSHTSNVKVAVVAIICVQTIIGAFIFFCIKDIPLTLRHVERHLASLHASSTPLMNVGASLHYSLARAADERTTRHQLHTQYRLVN